VESTPTVDVHQASGSGDDAIVDLVRRRHDENVVVATSDRGLRERVLALGATTVGPRSLPYDGRR
jgi:rRNA-processing protein FCF1